MNQGPDCSILKNKPSQSNLRYLVQYTAASYKE